MDSTHASAPISLKLSRFWARQPPTGIWEGGRSTCGKTFPSFLGERQKDEQGKISEVVVLSNEGLGLSASWKVKSGEKYPQCALGVDHDPPVGSQ